MSRFSLANANRYRIGLAGIGVLAFIAALVVPLAGLSIGKTTYSAMLESTGGIRVGEEVQVAGVSAGDITGVELDGQAVRVTFTMDSDIDLGAASTAEVKVATLLGTHFLLVTPGGDGDLDDNTIPMAQTRVPFNLQDAIDEATGDLAEFDTVELEASLQEFTEVLDASGEEIGPALDGVQELSGLVVERSGQLDAMLSAAREVTQQLTDSTPDLLALMEQGDLILDTLRVRRDAIHELLIDLTSLGELLSGVIDDNSDEIQPLLADLDVTVGVLQRHESTLDRAAHVAAGDGTLLHELGGHGALDGSLHAERPPGQPVSGPSTRGVPGTMMNLWERARSAVSAAILGAMLLSLGGCSVGGDGAITVTAQFRTTSGLFVGNDVGVLGVSIGSVTAIEPKGPIVEVTLRIDEGRDLPASAGAVIASRSVATDRYVEMTPAFADGPTLEDGAVIPVERTGAPVEFDEVLETLRTFSDGLRGPDGNADTLNRLLEVGAETLDGRGAQINETIGEFAAAADALAGNSDDIAGTITDLDVLTSTIAANQDTINEFLTSVRDATELFAAEQENFGDSLVALSDALSAIAEFSVENRSAIVNTTRGLTDVLENLLTHREALEQTVEVLPLTMENVGNAVTDEGRLLVKLPPQYFSPLQSVTEPLCDLLPIAICEQLGTSPDFLALLEDLVGLLIP